MRFRQYVWDPWLLVAQMVALQACFYLTMGVWIAAVTFIGVGHTVELQDMLTDAGMESAETGWFVVAAHLLTAATWYATIDFRSSPLPIRVLDSCLCPAAGRFWSRLSGEPSFVWTSL